MLKKIWTKIADRSRAPRDWWFSESKKDDRHADVVKTLHESY